MSKFINNGKNTSKGTAEAVYYNDSVHIIYDACRSCYGIEGEKSYDEIKDYIGRRVKMGHNSILEQSNIIIAIYDISKDYLEDLLNLLTAKKNPTKYLKIRKSDIKNNKLDILFQGSIRAYKHLIQNFNWDEEDNVIISHIRQCLYTCTVKEFWLDVSEDIMDPNSFVDNIFVGDDPDGYSTEDIEQPFTISIKDEDSKVTIVNIDPLIDILYLLHPTDIDLSDNEDLRELGTITVLFEDMSRTATHQLVRHRNAITQESQRYVDYTNAGFNIPDTIKEYLPDKETFEIEINGQKKLYTLDNLAKELCGIYGQLRNQGIKKEDARAFLPSNVQCHKIYMTFTYSTLFKFFELRCEKHAQAEIRKYAWELLNTLLSHSTSFINSQADHDDCEHHAKLYIPDLSNLRDKLISEGNA